MRESSELVAARTARTVSGSEEVCKGYQNAAV